MLKINRLKSSILSGCEKNEIIRGDPAEAFRFRNFIPEPEQTNPGAFRKAECSTCCLK